MVYENILFYRPNMVVRDSFFYLFDYTQGVLVQKRSNGGISFEFPVTIPTGFTSYAVSEVNCLQYDGFSFWTLQNFSDNSGIILRRWSIENYICVLKAQFPKISSPYIKYSSSTFSVEYYNTILSSSYLAGSSVISIDEYTDSVVYNGTLLGLVNEKFSVKETVTVSGIVGNDIYLMSNTCNSYYKDDLVTITPSIFLFNNYYLADATKGSIIVIDPATGSDLSYEANIDYLSITASKFCRLHNILNDYPDVHTLAYVKNTNLKLKNMSYLYRYKATLKGSDTFSGTNFSLPDSVNWQITKGDPYILNNQLYCTVAGSGHDKLLSTYNILGDFSVQVSGSCNEVSTYSGVAVEFKSFHYMGITCGDVEYTFGFDNNNTVTSGIDTSALHLYYEFDGNANDFLGHYNGTLVNSPSLTTGCDGKINGAYSFNGTSHIRVDSASILELGKNNADFSLVFWLKFTSNSNGNYRIITRKGNSDAQRTFAIWQYPSNNILHARISTVSDSNYGFNTNTSLALNTWYMVSYVKAASNFYVYINDFLDNSIVLTSSVVSNTGPIYIGDDPWHLGMPCVIDNFMIFNKAIDKDFVRILYFNFGKMSKIDDSFLPQFSIYVNDIKKKEITVSGVSYPYNYILKASKSSNILNLYYSTLVSGVQDSWQLLDSFISLTDCTLSLGLNANLVTTSGHYFSNLQYDYGYIYYPITSDFYYGTMGLDNVKVNQSTVIPIYAIDIESDNLYRLQNQATYYGTDYTWSTYNFQISPIRSFVDFITVDSDTHILPATGRNTAIVKSVTLDQYGQGVFNRPVTFIDDDTVGFITRPIVHTDIFYSTGIAETAYTSGTSLRVVNIVGEVTQED